MTRWDKITNVAVVLMCAVTLALAVDHFLARTAAPPANNLGARLTGDTRELLAPGATVTAIVVVGSKCKFCVASAGMYRRLEELQAKERGAFQTSIVSLLDIGDAERFARQSGLQTTNVRPTPDSLRQKVGGTPTLVIANAKGQVVATWTGQLTSREEANVFKTIQTVLRTQSAVTTTGGH